MANDKYVTFFSNSSMREWPSNNLSKFRNKLFTPMNLEGDWQVGLIDISVPFKCYNVEEIVIGLYAPVLVPIKFVNEETGYFGSPNAESEEVKNLPELDGSSPEPEVEKSSSFQSLKDGSETDTIEDSKMEESDKHITYNIDFIYKTGTIAAGYYSSTNELVNEIIKLYQKLFKKFRQSNTLLLDLNMIYYPHLNQVSFTALPLHNDTNSYSITISSNNNSLFEQVLGVLCDPETESYTSHEIFKFVVTQTSQRSSIPCSLKLYNKIYVCSDIINYQYIGSSSAPLLTSVSIDPNGYCKIGSTRYHPVNFHNIESIEMQIFSNIQNFESIPFSLNHNDSEFVEGTLHFKRQSLFQSCI